jgi:hypothetical protein
MVSGRRTPVLACHLISPPALIQDVNALEAGLVSTQRLPQVSIAGENCLHPCRQRGCSSRKASTNASWSAMISCVVAPSMSVSINYRNPRTRSGGPTVSAVKRDRTAWAVKGRVAKMARSHAPTSSVVSSGMRSPSVMATP